MARELYIEITGIGYEEAEDNLTGIERRAAMPFTDAIFRPMAEAEGRHFDRLAPKFERTGRLRRSYTRVRRSNDAIREAHGTTAEFGTRVPYARAAASRGGRYLLVIDEKGQDEVADVVANYIIDPRNLRHELAGRFVE